MLVRVSDIALYVKVRQTAFTLQTLLSCMLGLGEIFDAMTANVKPGNSPSTIIDVAEAAGVSMKTVSRVVNREPNVTAKTRERVLKAIDELGYQRNIFARGLRADRSLVLGLLYENPKGDYSSDILHGALGQCREHGYHLVVEILGGENMGEQTSRFLSQTRLDGVLMTPPVCDNVDVIKALNKNGVPFVRISPHKPKRGEQFIGIDDFSAAKEVVDYLVTMGHHRIGFIEGIPGHASTQARLDGYCQALNDHKIAIDDALITEGNFDLQSGFEGACRLLSEKPAPTAIFACNDEAAAGILSFAHANDISVPGDLSVCGFDGGTISKVVWPQLTTVMQPIRSLGENAIRTLIKLSAREELQNDPVILPHKLVIGGSTATR